MSKKIFFYAIVVFFVSILLTVDCRCCAIGIRGAIQGCRLCRRHIPFKIPLNKNVAPKNSQIGVPMLLHRDCPEGFQMEKNRFCVVKENYLDKLPDGSYSFQALRDKSSLNCHKGFKEKDISNNFSGGKIIMCTKESQSNQTIEFPSYVTPESQNIIFLAISLSTNCPSMMSSIVVKRSKLNGNVTTNICYYFNKMSANEYKEVDSRCQCHKDAACFPTFDHVKCQCKSGYFGNGKTICSKIDNSTDRCGNACNNDTSICVALNITNECQCKEGFEGNGFSCKPSCKTRKCNVFSHCVVKHLESYCACLPKTIQAYSNRCHGDYLSSISMLDEFDQLKKCDLKLLSSDSNKHLVSSNSSKILFILITPQPESTCRNFGKYHALTEYQFPKAELKWRADILTENYLPISISKDEKNQWMVDDTVVVKRVDLFTNAIVLYLNSSLRWNYHFAKPKNLVSKDPIIAGYLTLALFTLAVITGLIIWLAKSRRIDFNRLRESRSETNINFFSEENQNDLDS